MAKVKKSRNPGNTVEIPRTTFGPTGATTNGGSPTTPKTPKTPADEGLDFFESAIVQGEEPIKVYELQLDPDGGPNKDRSVSILK